MAVRRPSATLDGSVPRTKEDVHQLGESEPTDVTRPESGGSPRASGRRNLVTLVVDLVAPIALYYGLRAVGVGIFPALVVGAVAPALSAVVMTIRGQKVTSVGLSVMTMLLVSAGLSLLTGSPRFLLAKDGGLTAVWGAWFFASLLGQRPVTFTFARPLLEGRRVFDPTMRRWVSATTESWDSLWERSPRFRRVWQVSTVIWGLATLLDAAIRIGMAYTLPVDLVPGLGGALWPITFFVLQVITNVYFLRAGLWLILRREA
jgi:hypothetical protein